MPSPPGKRKRPERLRASVLDRLIDTQPERQVENEKSRHQLMAEIRESVRRDLEKLLNTRFRCISGPENCEELKNSLINYGLPDLNVINFLNAAGSSQFCKLVEDHIKRFEPRFKSVRVVLKDENDNIDRSLKFRIEALMHADPAPEEIVFDSSLEPSTNNVEIENVN